LIDPKSARTLAHAWEASQGDDKDGTPSRVGQLFGTREVLDVDRAAALPHGLVQELIDVGLVEQVGEGIRGTVQLSSWEGFVVAHDPSNPLELRSDSVGGINPTTRTLAALTVRRPVARALDVGTGCGAQALLAARHADEVVATDVNPRALWLTEINAAINGLTNITCVEGSMFDPVAGEKFDLVVGNLPFVVSPDSDYAFRDSGLPGDDVSRIAVEGAASALNPGGYAHLMCNWMLEPETHWSDRPLAWFTSLECSAWLLYYSDESSRDYAEKWNRALLRNRPDEYLDTVERWVVYHNDIGAVAIANGAIVLYGDDLGTRRVDRMAVPPQGDGGSQVERAFSATAHIEDRDLIEAVITLVSPHDLRQLLRHQDRRYVAADAQLVLDDTAGVAGDVAPMAAHALLRLDGQRALGDVIEQAVEETGLDRDELLDTTIGVLAELGRQGIVDVRWPD
jgi:methylase of polypeptide subunit release factors